MRKYVDKPKSHAEVVEESRNRHADIDGKLREARQKINWKRRRAAEKSPAAWMKTYCLGPILSKPPPPKGVQILESMDSAVGAGRPYLILMSRGFGKTSYTKGEVAYCVATGKCKFCVVVSLNKDAAKQIVEDIFRLFMSAPFSDDYPDIALPLLLKNGAWKRRQLSGGKSTECRFSNGELILPCVVDDDGKPVPTSGGAIVPKALKAVRGTVRGSLRPDLVVLDDLQTTEDADNPSTVEKKLRYIRNDVMNVGGEKALSIINTATVIAPDDLAEKLANDSAWRTIRFKAFDTWPTDFAKHARDGLWAQYFHLFDKDGEKSDTHPTALRFYRKNRRAMDAGADVLNPDRFDRERGQISCVQHLMDKYHVIGRSAFMAEYQMMPEVGEAVIDISPKKVRTKAVDMPPFAIPPGTAKVVVGTDLNLSYAITSVILAIKPDTTAHVVYHETFETHVDGKLSGQAYYDAVYPILVNYGRRLLNFGVKIDAWGIDINGANFKAGADYVKSVGAPVFGTVGKNSMGWNATTRNRVEDAVGRTVMLGDDKERVQRGAGIRWVWFDSDFYREQAQIAMAQPLGAVGGLTLYADDGRDRDEFVVQFCNEQLQWKHERLGRTEYHWKTAEPHDYLDATAIAYAIAARQNISVGRHDAPIVISRPKRRAAVSII